MRYNRRQAMQIFGAAGVAAATRLSAQNSKPPVITLGPFRGTRASLQSYRIPQWFADAKFGIWAHWGPQSAVGDGDWYARNMYREGTPQYQYHLQRFGPQSKVGYKDLIHLYTADRWDPNALIDLYIKAGATYFVSMGVHHDNYDLWNSKHQRRWNSVVSGPKRDVVGLWAAAARRRGLRFGVSEHLSNSYDWFAPSHLHDTKGAYAGIPYDGAGPQFADLYHSYIGQPANFAETAAPMGRVAPDAWKRQYFARIHDLIEQHHPDLLYTDGGIPFDEYGLALVADVYNVSAKLHGGRVESVYNSKTESDCLAGTCALDRERGVLDGIRAEPWQTDTCIGDWHYKKGFQYKSAKKVIDLLVDIVSKNGNLLLNFPLPASGELDTDERKVLEGITAWMTQNREGIFGTRPWKVFGEGPSLAVEAGAGMNEDKTPDLTAADVRFTTKGGAVYAFVQGKPSGAIQIKSLSSSSTYASGRVGSVRVLGSGKTLSFRQTPTALQLDNLGDVAPSAEIGIGFEIRFV
jgi:alpha-L-fucosidase